MLPIKMDKERWKPISDFPGYEISDHGRIRSFKKQIGFGNWVIVEESQRMLKPGRTRTNGGYLYVHLCRNGIPSIHKVAKLVMEAFVGSRPEGTEVCHNDCNPVNNHLSNLRYDTRASNLQDGCGSHAKKRLTNNEAYQLRQLAARGIKDSELALRFNTGIKNVLYCRLGHAYRHVDGPITRHQKLNEDQVEEIRCMANQGKSLQSELANEYGVDEALISRIVYGLVWQSAGGPIKKSEKTILSK